MVEKLKSNPLTRALRCDKLCLSALEATLRLYLDPEKARKSVPTLRMLVRQSITYPAPDSIRPVRSKPCQSLRAHGPVHQLASQQHELCGS